MPGVRPARRSDVLLSLLDVSITHTHMSTREILLQYVCPAFGMITANLMFSGERCVSSHICDPRGIYMVHLVPFAFVSAPFHDVRRAVSHGTLGHLNPTPWAAMTGNCIGWVTYSYLIQVCLSLVQCSARYHPSRNQPFLELVCFLGKCTRIHPFNLVKYGRCKATVL